MQRSVAFISCVGKVNYPRTLLFLKTSLEMGCSVITIMPGAISDTSLESQVTHITLPSPKRNFWYDSNLLYIILAIIQRVWISLLLLRKLLFLKPAICLCSEPDAWLVAIITKKLVGCKVVVDLREVYEDRGLAFPRTMQRSVQRLLRSLMKSLSKYTDEVIHVSEERKRIYGYLNKEGVVIGNYPEISSFRLDSCDIHAKAAPESIIAIHAGALRASYAAEQLLDAMKLVAEVIPNVKFIALGGVAGSLSNMNLVAALSKAGILELAEQIPPSGVARWLAISDIGISLVLPIDRSHFLAAPQKLYEYLAMGLPVVGANVPTIQKVLVENDCGLVVDPTSPTEIASAIIRLAQDEDLRNKMSENGRRAAETRFNWENEASILRAVFQSLACNSSLDKPVDPGHKSRQEVVLYQSNFRDGSE